MIDGLAIVGGHLLDTHRLTDSLFYAAHLTDLRNASLCIDNHLDFLLATLMTIESQGRLRLLSNTYYCRGVAQYIAVHQQEILASHHLHRKPQREDIVVVLVVGIVDKGNIECGEMGCKEVPDLVGAIACHHHKLLDACL